MDHPIESHSSISLVSRLDHLEFLMKFLERKQDMLRTGHTNNSVRGAEKQCVPLDLALRDAYLKGSLLERVESLENRLFQLCLVEMECSSTTTSRALTQTSGESSSSRSSKGEQTSSSLTFSNRNHIEQKTISQIHINRLLGLEKSRRFQQKRILPNPVDRQVGASRDDKACKTGKKRVQNPNWPHLRILGC